jgi:hypothetical protein
LFNVESTWFASPHGLQMEEKGAVFEEVDEAAYAKLVAERRRKDDFVVDDDGLGYADGGEEDMGGDDDDGGDDGGDSDGSDGEGGTRGRGAAGALRSAAYAPRTARACCLLAGGRVQRCTLAGSGPITGCLAASAASHACWAAFRAKMPNCVLYDVALAAPFPPATCRRCLVSSQAPRRSWN